VASDCRVPPPQPHRRYVGEIAKHVADGMVLVMLATVFVAFEAIWPAAVGGPGGWLPLHWEELVSSERMSAQNLKPLGPIQTYGTLLGHR
jgi:hypothetical protein